MSQEFFIKQGYDQEAAAGLVKAEEASRESGFSYTWETDKHQDVWKKVYGTDEEIFSCTLRNSDGEVLGTATAIVEPNDEMKRLVQAELAEEALRKES